MAQRKKKSSGGDDIGGAPGWMVTYGDLMSLLLTFFVLLLSFSTINEEEFKEALRSFQGMWSVLPANLSIIAPEKPNQAKRRTPRAVEQVARKLMEKMQVEGMENAVNVELDKEKGGLTITLPNRILFEPGEADLRPEAFPVLANVAEVLQDVPGALIDVRGHTDNSPLQIASRFADNWELSFFRAKAVTAFLEDENRGGIASSRLEVTGCGSGKPRETNDTPEGRQANRRVELSVQGDFNESEKSQIQGRLTEQDRLNPAWTIR